jgi:hypothetical protein
MSFGEILSFIGIPTAVTAFAFGMLKYYIERNERSREKRESVRDQNMVYLISCANASLDLSEAVAISLKNGKCNGEIAAAQETANRVRQEYAAFLTAQGVKNLQ